MNNNNFHKAIGIDAGTTNSVIAHINNQGQSEVIPSSEGGRTIPSVFAIAEDGTKLIGKPAVDQELANSNNTIRSIKRKMGTPQRFMVHESTLSPEEISSEILKKIKNDAESYLGETVDAAVITVPAYFNSDQRQATKTAGELAGLKVLRVINEPTAAALAYGLDKNKNETVLVFDLGGGTFDVTVLKITDDGVFDVKSTAGDTFLGGDDFDVAISEDIMSQIGKEYCLTIGCKDCDKMHLEWFPETAARIRDASEQAKIQLSSMTTANVNLPYIGMKRENSSPVNFSTKITREQFEHYPRVIKLLEKIKTCVDLAISDARLEKTDIDEVVFVGGSTRIPLISQIVEEWIGKKPNKSINPDEAVALGAAIQAGVLSGQSDKTVLLLDVTPLSLGIETLGGVMSTMITRNTTIPVEYNDIFSTAEDNQEKVSIRVYQGERPQVKNNKFLGEFQLTDILPAPRGIPQIELTFDIDANGILSVKAVDKATDLEQKIIITGSSSLSAEELQKIMEDAQKNVEQDNIFKALADLHNQLQEQLIQIDSVLRESSEELSAALIKKLNASKRNIEKSTTIDNTETLQSLSDSVKQLIEKASEYLYKKADEYIQGE